MNSPKVYHKSDDITIKYEDITSVIDSYNKGYLFTRVSKGNMIQTRSLRVDLAKFELNSENRRILNKNENLQLSNQTLPLENYSWKIHAMGKVFYTKRFGDGTMSASKIKEMFNEMDKSNMNSVFTFEIESKIVGYCLAFQTDEIIHYAYPFYDLEIPKEQNLGIGMMTKAILWAKESGRKYMYLGTVVEPSSKYKLQFEGLEWFDPENQIWSTDMDILKNLLTSQ